MGNHDLYFSKQKINIFGGASSTAATSPRQPQPPHPPRPQGGRRKAQGFPQTGGAGKTGAGGANKTRGADEGLVHTGCSGGCIYYGESQGGLPLCRRMYRYMDKEISGSITRYNTRYHIFHPFHLSGYTGIKDITH